MSPLWQSCPALTLIHPVKGGASGSSVDIQKGLTIVTRTEDLS